MMQLTFMFGREMMHFAIKDKEIYYKDRVFDKAIRCIPKDEDFIKKVIMSRNRYPKKLLEMFNLSKKQQEEYESAKTEDDLAEIIIKDCKSKGIKLIGRIAS